MTLSADIAFESYTIVDENAPLNFAHPWEFDDELAVFEDGTLLDIGADYSLVGAGLPGGGTINPVAATLGSKWVIYRMTRLAQVSVPSDNIVGFALDRLTRAVQDARRDIDRSLKVDFDEAPLKSIPRPIQPGHALVGNADGDGFTYSDTNVDTSTAGINARIDAEIVDRTEGDAALADADSALSQRIDDEEAARITADNVLMALISGGVADPEAVKLYLSLDQVDNTSDLDKPVSTATQAELDAKQLLIDDLDDRTTATQAELDALELTVADVAIAASSYVFTKTALLARTVPLAVTAILLAGNAAAGDDFGGEGRVLSRDPAAVVGFITDASGAKWADKGEKFYFSKSIHGADPTDTTSNTAALTAALDEVKAKKGHLVVPKGTYRFTTPMALTTMDCNFEVTWASEAVFKTTSAVTTALIKLQGGVTPARPEFAWTFNNARIDCSAGAYTGNQTSGLSLNNVRSVKGVGGWLYGGVNHYATPTIGGDSAIEPLNITHFVWRDCWFQGWHDAGIYSGGNNDPSTADDGKIWLVDGNYFVGCTQGVVHKRAGNAMQVSNNWFELCEIGATTADVGAGQEVLSGRDFIVVNNTFVRCFGRAVGIRSNSKGHVYNNLFKNWGYNSAGTTPGAAPAALGAILCEGGLDSKISGNMFIMDGFADAGHIGICVMSYTDADATFWPGGRLTGEGNTFTGCTIPLYEAATVTTGTRLTDNRVTTTPTFANIRNGSIFEYTSPGNAGTLLIKGNASNVGERFIAQTVGFRSQVSGTLLSAIGSLAAGATSAVITGSMPGALPGDSVDVTLNSSAGFNPNLSVMGRISANDTWAVIVKNNHASAVDFTAQSVTIMAQRCIS